MSLRALAVGFSADEFQRFEPALSGAGIVVDRFPDALGALELIGPLPIELLIVRYPLDGISIETFLDAVRQPETASRACSLLLAAPVEHVDAARQYLGRGVNRVVDLGESGERMLEEAAALARIAPRKPSNYLAQLQSGRGKSMDYVVGEVLNSSQTGALVASDRKLPPGAEVLFHFSLPDGFGPVVGVGQVVRHTRPEREDIDGLGLRFLSFQGDSRKKYFGFLRGAAAPAAAARAAG